jgi:hypothetical protein
VRKRDREAADDGRGCLTCIHAVRVRDIGLAGLARPCWAASPFRYFFISKKSNTEYNRKGGQGERKG